MQTEQPKLKSDQQEITDDKAKGVAKYKKRLEDAVVDSQYMMMYASSNLQSDIDRNTIERLIGARHRLEKGEELSAEEEADFWLAYQELWKLVQPATADSVKANLLMEREFISSLFDRVPILSRWLGNRTSTKARRTMNGYVAFSLIVLLLLIILQIYWVIGNQLTSKLESLLQTESTLNTQLDDNQREYSTIEILYKQKEMGTDSFKANKTFTFYSSPEWDRDTLDNVTEGKRLQTELESIKTQIDRSSAILLIWSAPWKERFLDEKPSEVEPIHSDKYAAQFDDLEEQIAVIEGNLAGDPEGTKEAQRLNDTINPQLDFMNAQFNNLLAANDELNVHEQELQARIDNIQSQLSDLDNLNDAAAREKLIGDLNTKLQELNADLSDLEAKQTVIQYQQQDISTQLAAASTDISQDPSQEISLTNALVAQLNELDAQLKELEDQKAGLQAQIVELNVQLSALSGDNTTLENRKRDLLAEQVELESQLKSIQVSKSNNNDQLVSLQSQGNALVALLVSPEEIVNQWKREKDRLSNDKNSLERKEQADAKRESASQAQLAGKFVLDILQGYLLPLFYGVLGAATFVLRDLSKQIKEVTYSERAGIQHFSRISLGALAGIVVGWFSFLIDTTTFLGSVSPLAIAFLVGYNIEVFFSLMDIAINRIKQPEPDSSTVGKESAPVAPPPEQEGPPQEKPVAEEVVG